MNKIIYHCIVMTMICSTCLFAQQQDSWTNFTTANGLADNRVIAICQASDSTLWFGTDGGGVSHYADGAWTTFTIAEGLVNNIVNSICETKDKALWLGTYNGISRYQNGIWTTINTMVGLTDNRVNVIYEAADGALWVGTYGGVSYYQNGAWNKFTTADGLVSNRVNAIIQSSDGAIWFGTDKGVSHFKDTMWTTFNTSHGLADNTVNTIDELGDMVLWFGTKAGVSRFYSNTWTTFTNADGLADNWINAICKSYDHALWFGTRAGVSRYKNDIWKSFSEADGLANNYVKSIAVSNDGALWFGTYGGGVSRYLGYTPSPIIKELPQGVMDGINYISDTTITFSIFAPNKQFSHVIGDFNDWKVNPAYLMYQTPDRNRFWLTIIGLKPHQEYLYQYLVEDDKRIADPYCEKISDPWNDQYISSQTYPDLISYPTGKTTEIASVFKIGEQLYQWEIENFNRPAQKDLLIYELLVRDFIKEHDYKTLIDTLGYFERLGINAIELMPINEFEGNISWGYNPSFYFVPDKYYGLKNDLKRFVDECHKRGIAVILAIVLNHSFGQSPLVRLFSDGNYGPPSSNNPWYNVTSTHPYSVGYDFNHESTLTKIFVDSVTTFWLKEYKIDGYRFDLSKGFTQNLSGDDVGLWSAYDASRIAILKRIANHIWSVDSTAYIILEHFAENREEQELAEYGKGILLWNNLNSAYSQSAMGWLEDFQRSSDLSWGYFKTRNWSKPGLITYMESHDEPWLMYKNLSYGRSSGDYNIKNLATALDRIKLVAAFFFTIPGPKMMWQFGELGYDQYLPESGSGRTAPKPILWNYYDQPERRSLYETIAALIKLRSENSLFRDPKANVNMRVGQGQYDRRINISNNEIAATIIGNFGVTKRDVIPNFQTTGIWYDYFSGDSLEITSPQSPLSLLPGEFHIFTDKKLKNPLITTVSKENFTMPPTSFVLEQNHPNPFNSKTVISYRLSEAKPTQTMVRILNILGQEVKTLVNEKQAAGNYQVLWDGCDNLGKPVSSGVYLYSIVTDRFHTVKKLVFCK